MNFLGEMTFTIFAGYVVTLLGVLVLIVVAFGTSAAWGFVSLLFPPASLVFALAHWQRARVGFAIACVGLVTLAVGYSIKPKDQPVSSPGYSRTVTPKETEPAREAGSKTPAAGDAAEEAPGEGEKIIPPPPAPSAQPRVIQLSDAHKYVHSEIRITTVDNTKRVGTLLVVGANVLVLEIPIKGTGGTVRTKIPISEVREVELMP